MTIIRDNLSLHIEKLKDAGNKARKDSSFASQQG